MPESSPIEGSAQAAVDSAEAALRAHPMFDRLFRLYRNALLDWTRSGAIQNAAKTLGMDRRAYCDSRLADNQFQWFAAGTHEPITPAHVELAWSQAVGEL